MGPVNFILAHHIAACSGENVLLVQCSFWTARPNIEKLMEFISKMFAGEKYFRLWSLISRSNKTRRRHLSARNCKAMYVGKLQTTSSATNKVQRTSAYFPSNHYAMSHRDIVNKSTVSWDIDYAIISVSKTVRRRNDYTSSGSCWTCQFACMPSTFWFIQLLCSSASLRLPVLYNRALKA